MEKNKKENQTSNPTSLVAGADGKTKTRSTNRERNTRRDEIDKLKEQTHKALNISKIDTNDDISKFGLSGALSRLTPAELLALAYELTTRAAKYSEEHFVSDSDERELAVVEYFIQRELVNAEANKILRDVFDWRFDGYNNIWEFLGIEPTP